MSAALVATIAVGVTSVVTTIVGIVLLGYIGRRTMLLIGFAGVAASQLALSLVFLLPESTTRSYVILGCMMVFVAFVQMFIGTCVWLLLSEIFPLSIRGFAMGIAVFVLWCTNAIISFLFPLLNSALGSTGTFVLFVAINVGSWLFVRRSFRKRRARRWKNWKNVRGTGREASGRGCRLTQTRYVNAALNANRAAFAVAGGPRLHTDRAGEADVAQRRRDGGVVDLAGARLTAAGHIGDLNLTDGVAAAPDQLDEIALADLRVIEVQHHPHVGVADVLDERQRVLRPGQGDARMVDDGVEVLHAEGDACRLPEFADPLERALRGQPHFAGGPMTRPGGLAVDEFCGV